MEDEDRQLTIVAVIALIIGFLIGGFALKHAPIYTINNVKINSANFTCPGCDETYHVSFEDGFNIRIKDKSGQQINHCHSCGQELKNLFNNKSD